MWLLKSGPACTNSISLSILSITIRDDFDLYASSNTLLMPFALPWDDTPTNFSGEINLM